MLNPYPCFITMVLPVTGPISREVGTGSSLYHRLQTIWRQKRPIDRPLAYTGLSRRTFNVTRPGSFDDDAQSFNANNLAATDQAHYQYAINDAASKLRSKISDSALWAVNLAEYGQSLEMMIKRLQQISKFTRGVLKRDPGMMIDAVGLVGSQKLVDRRRLLKGAADTWLEWSFGWKPLVADIFATVDLLQNPIKAQKVKVRRVYTVSGVDLITVDPSLIYTRRTRSGTEFCSMGCEVAISNPNLYLANNLGLTNPALVIWELVPFSFVVDWFVSVGQFLENGSAWLGLTVTNPYTTYGTKLNVLKENLNVFDTPSTWSSSAELSFMSRRLSIIESAIIVKPQKLWPWQRAANAAAVTAQLVSSVQRK